MYSLVRQFWLAMEDSSSYSVKKTRGNEDYIRNFIRMQGISIINICCAVNIFLIKLTLIETINLNVCYTYQTAGLFSS